MPTTPRTRITLVRHGETSANLEGVWHGSTDTPLTERGHAQAERVAGYLERQPGSAALYVSDLQRARHTAAPISTSLAVELRVERGLREYDLGRWEGKTYRELHERFRLWHHMRRDPEHRPHGGESPRQVVARMTGALERIAADHPGERVVVVTHGGALSLALAMLLEGDYTRWGRVMDNCAVAELALGGADRKPAELLRFNVTEHLADL